IPPRRGMGLPAPGRLSKAPRSAASAICWSIHEAKLISRGLRSVMPISMLAPCRETGVQYVSGMDRIERREFVRKHRTCIFGYNRRNDGPAMTMVYYLMDGDDMLISTMAGGAKALAAKR